MRTLFFLLFVAKTLAAQQSYWQQGVHYTIDALLDTDIHHIIGSERLIYRNNSPDTLRTVYFHLYWNLFTPGSYGHQLAERNKNYNLNLTGGMTIESIAILDQDAELIPLYEVDNTIMQVQLISPLGPGDSVTFRVDFNGDIPEGRERAGHNGREYAIAQWYPQIAVYDRTGWHTEQYLGPGEFYNEYGTFDVSVTLPRSFTLGYSGTLLNPEEVLPDSVRVRLEEARRTMQPTQIADYTEQEWGSNDTALVTWRFRAENVRDFAWAAYEYYVWDVAYLDLPGRPPVAVHVMYQEDKREFWKDLIHLARFSVQYFSEQIGMYAYTNVFAVETCTGGGMEYPGITFIGHVGDRHGRWLPGALVHEIGHNWFPMMIGTNELAHAFMDEGFTTHITTRALEAYYGRFDNRFVWDRWYHQLLHVPNDSEREETQRSALFLATTGYEDPIITHVYRFRDPVLFGSSIYSKTSAVLFMLEYVIGEAAFADAMRTYFERWKFRHPSPQDFFAVVEETSGRRNLNWFFDEWFYKTSVCDYGLDGFTYRPVSASHVTTYETTLNVARYGDAIMPLDIRIAMADGSDTTVWIPVDRWMNAETSQSLTINLPSSPVRADINPDGRILDANRLNNGSCFPVAIRLDNTLFNVQPVDAYLVTWRPSLWYTNEGGVKLGLRLRGSYLDEQFVTGANEWFNLRDRTLNYDLSVSHNMYHWTPISSVRARYFRIEGRHGLSVWFQKEFRRRYSVPPSHTLQIGYSYSQADDTRYLLRPETWDEGVLQRMLVNYRYSDNGEWWVANATATLETAAPIIGRNDFEYTKRTITISPKFYMPGGWTLATRLFHGVGQGNVPPQTQYYLASSSPLEQLDVPLLRSRTILPRALHEHTISQGGGTMRGYYRFLNEPTASSGRLPGSTAKLEAFNIEARFPTIIPFVNTPIPYLSRYVWSAVFLDAGRVAGSGGRLWDQRFECDAGFGVRLISFERLLGPFAQSSLLSTIGLQALRLDFPVYVSSPYAGENRWRFRWVVSINESF
jgi:hypothetical protein